MPRRKGSPNSPEGPRDRVDRDGLDWALTKIREWRSRVKNRIGINEEWITTQMLRLGERGVQESLVGFVILGCEWMFRLRTLRPSDAKIVLARIESRLLPVLHGDAWLVTEALAPPIRKLMKIQRVLAPEWEDMAREVFVATTPKSPPAQLYDVGYLARLRTRPDPLIRARRGPAPKLAPWIAGVIVERLVAKQRGKGYQLTLEEQECVLEFVSALCGRAIDTHEYIARRRRLVGIQELDTLVQRFKSSHDLFVSWGTQTTRQDHPDWFRVVRARLERFGARDTFPYDLETISKLVDACVTSPPRDRG